MPRLEVPVSYKAEFRKYWKASFAQEHDHRNPPGTEDQDYVDVATFADRLGRTKDSVRKMIEEHRIFALKVGRYVVVVSISMSLLCEDEVWVDPDKQ